MGISSIFCGAFLPRNHISSAGGQISGFVVVVVEESLVCMGSL